MTGPDPERDDDRIASLTDRIIDRLPSNATYRLDHREEELSRGNARRVLARLAEFRHDGFSFTHFLEKLAHVLGMAGESSRPAGERALLLNAAGFFLAGIGRALDELGGDGRILGFSGELSGIFEVAAKRGTVFRAIDIQGDEDDDMGGLEFVDVSIQDRDGQTVKEFDAVSENAVFEFKFNATLKKLYEQVLGVGDGRSHIELLARDRRFRRIQNLVYFGENAGGSGEIAPAIAAYSHASGIPCDRSKRGGIGIRMTLDDFRDFVQDPETLRLLRQEAGALANAYRWKSVIDRLGSDDKTLERIDGLLAEIGTLRRGRAFDCILALSNCPSDLAGCDG